MLFLANTHEVKAVDKAREGVDLREQDGGQLVCRRKSEHDPKERAGGGRMRCATSCTERL